MTSNIEILPLDDSRNDLIWHHQTAFKNKGLSAVRKTGFSKQTFKGTITQIVAYNCIPLSVKEHNWLHSRQRNKKPEELKCIDTGLGHQEKIKELFRKEIVNAYNSEKKLNSLSKFFEKIDNVDFNVYFEELGIAPEFEK